MKKIFIVETPSGARFGNCLLGHGPTRAAAIADAYGPDGKLPRHAWVREVTAEEFEEMREYA
jgi:hypothetical protein